MPMTKEQFDAQNDVGRRQDMVMFMDNAVYEMDMAIKAGSGARVPGTVQEIERMRNQMVRMRRAAQTAIDVIIAEGKRK